jgi:glycosyltransferase involved in cell wall biosynthesis
MNRRVLCLFLEFNWWEPARPLTYTAQLGLEDGLRANGCHVLTVTTPWLPRLREICRGQRFDQVWIEIVHQEALDDELLSFVAERAPVRVGIVLESIGAAPPQHRARRRHVEHRLKFLTHVLTVDELDAAEIERAGDVRACWWPQAVPRRFLAARPPAASPGPAVFRGSLYGDRIAMTQDTRLADLLLVRGPLEEGTPDPRIFERLQMTARTWATRRLPRPRTAAALHLFTLRRLRQRIFRRWLRALSGDAAVVNLPHAVGAYPGRVVEAMAVGRPVVAWDVPDRPRNRALFQDGAGILLFSGTESLAEVLRRLREDPALAAAVAANGWREVARAHTAEHRTRQVLEWTDTDVVPTFS